MTYWDPVVKPCRPSLLQGSSSQGAAMPALPLASLCSMASAGAQSGQGKREGLGGAGPQAPRRAQPPLHSGTIIFGSGFNVLSTDLPKLCACMRVKMSKTGHQGTRASWVDRTHKGKDN